MAQEIDWWLTPAGTGDGVGAPSDRLRVAIEGAGFGTWEWDLATNGMTWSPTTSRLLGVSVETRPSHALFLAALHPQDRARVDGTLRAAAENGTIFSADYRIPRTDGSDCWLRARGRAFRKPGEAFARMSGIILDITEEKRTEDDLRQREAGVRSVLATVPDAMIVIDEHGAIQLFSEAAKRLFDYSLADVQGRNVSMLMPEPDRSRHDQYIKRYCDTEVPRIIGIGRVVTGRRRDGSTFPMHLSVGEARSGNQRHFTGLVRDLTERQEIMAQMQVLQAELLHVSRLSAMGQMASTLAHELNQPLAAINNYLKGCSALLEQQGDPLHGNLRFALDRAAAQALRAGQIISRLRDFVRRGDTEKKLEKVSKLVDEASALALVGAREQGIRLQVDVSASVESVVVDRVQIQQVLINLLRNAMESMRDSPRRELLVTVVDTEHAMVEIAVSDTGHGIPPDVMAKLFQPFVTTKESGMGVGLSISRTIVEAHGGRMWVEQNPAGGAVFRFTLPAAREAD